jgi:hypothetical protein
MARRNKLAASRRLFDVIALIGSISSIATIIIPSIEKTQYSNVLYGYAVEGAVVITAVILILFILLHQFHIFYLTQIIDGKSEKANDFLIKTISFCRRILIIAFSLTLAIYFLLPLEPSIKVISPERHFPYNPDVIPYKLIISNYKSSMKLYAEYGGINSVDVNKKLLDFDIKTGQAVGEIHDERYLAAHKKIQILFLLEKNGIQLTKSRPILLHGNR